MLYHLAILVLVLLLPSLAPAQILPKWVDTGPLAADDDYNYTEPELVQPTLPGPARLVNCSTRPAPKPRLLFASYISIESRTRWETDDVNLLRLNDVLPDGRILLAGVRQHNGRQRIWLGVASGKAPLEAVLPAPVAEAEYRVLLAAHRDGGYVAVVQNARDGAAWRMDLDHRLRSTRWLRLELPAAAYIAYVATDLTGRLRAGGTIKGDSRIEFQTIFDARGGRVGWSTAPEDSSLPPAPASLSPASPDNPADRGPGCPVTIAGLAGA